MGNDTARPTDNASSTPPSSPSGPMTRSRAKAIHDKVNSLLYMCDLDPTLDGTLPHANALCILRYDPQAHLHGRMEAGHEDGREEGEEEKILGPVGTEPGMGRGIHTGTSRSSRYHCRYGTGPGTGPPRCSLIFCVASPVPNPVPIPGFIPGHPGEGLRAS